MPDYYDVIKNPRDLGTIKKNLIRKKYETPQEFYEVRPHLRHSAAACCEQAAPCCRYANNTASLHQEATHAEHWCLSQDASGC